MSDSATLKVRPMRSQEFGSGGDTGATVYDAEGTPVGKIIAFHDGPWFDDAGDARGVSRREYVWVDGGQSGPPFTVERKDAYIAE